MKEQLRFVSVTCGDSSVKKGGQSQMPVWFVDSLVMTVKVWIKNKKISYSFIKMNVTQNAQ